MQVNWSIEIAKEKEKKNRLNKEKEESVGQKELRKMKQRDEMLLILLTDQLSRHSFLVLLEWKHTYHSRCIHRIRLPIYISGNGLKSFP